MPDFISLFAMLSYTFVKPNVNKFVIITNKNKRRNYLK